MTTALTMSETAQAPILPGSAEAKPTDARSAATDFLQIESIVLNLDASLRVHARAHFFSWTQGLLQSLIRHELLICTLSLGKPPAFPRRPPSAPRRPAIRPPAATYSPCGKWTS